MGVSTQGAAACHGTRPHYYNGRCFRFRKADTVSGATVYLNMDGETRLCAFRDCGRPVTQGYLCDHHRVRAATLFRVK